VPFVLGASKQMQVSYGGRLYLGINDVMSGSGQAQITDSSSKYSVDITVTGASGASTATAQSATATVTTSASARNLAAETSSTPTTEQAHQLAQVSTLDAKLVGQAEQLINGMPRRVADASGGAGDMVNFMIVGPQQKMLDAMAAAGWLIVDRDKKQATVHALLSTLEKKTYTEMPMSELYLFGRSQDYGFARAEPIAVATTRNHLRMWKTDQTLNGQTVWVGAATHDIGLERDQRNNGITHKIDPEIDKEREFLGTSLNDTGLLVGLTHVLPKDPVQTAKTATGGSFFSDGRVLVLLLK